MSIFSARARSFPLYAVHVLERGKQDLIVLLLGAVLYDVQHRLQHGGQDLLRLQLGREIRPDVLICEFLRKRNGKNARMYVQVSNYYINIIVLYWMWVQKFSWILWWKNRSDNFIENDLFILHRAEDNRRQLFGNYLVERQIIVFNKIK